MLLSLSFSTLLDNLMGIILRLLLVALAGASIMGARLATQHGLKHAPAAGSGLAEQNAQQPAAMQGYLSRR
jgi:hypothetical protein